MKVKSLKDSFDHLSANDQYYEHGYSMGIRDAIKTIKSLLQHNDIKMDVKEFHKEYNHLKREGKIK